MSSKEHLELLSEWELFCLNNKEYISFEDFRKSKKLAQEPVAWRSEDWKLLVEASQKIFWPDAKIPLYEHAAPAVALKPVAWLKIMEDGCKCLSGSPLHGWAPLVHQTPAGAVNYQLLEICKKLWRESEQRSRHKGSVDPDFVLKTIGDAIAAAEAAKRGAK